MAKTVKAGRKSGANDRKFLVSETDNVYDAYRQLAVTIVQVAAEDYIRCLTRPNYEKECETLHRHWVKGMAMKRIIMNLSEDKVDEARTYFLDAAKEAYATGLFPKTNRTCNLLGCIDRLEKPCTLPELKNIVQDYRKRVGQMRSVWNEKNARRSGERERIERFFKSEQFTLYTGGLIDPYDLMEECGRRAKSGQWHIEIGSDYE